MKLAQALFVAQSRLSSSLLTHDGVLVFCDQPARLALDQDESASVRFICMGDVICIVFSKGLDSSEITVLETQPAMILFSRAFEMFS